MSDSHSPSTYGSLLADIKQRVASAQTRATMAVNSELVRLYWEIGHSLSERKKVEGYGAKVIDRLSQDLKAEFPSIKGFSSRNLKYMRVFAEQCPSGLIGQQAAAQLPWFHIVTLLTQLDVPEIREWYAKAALQDGWSRSTLEVNLKNRLHERQGQAISNFPKRLPAGEALMAQEALKDPYLFDFLGLGADAHERDIEDALVRHVTRFLLELGAGFAFVGRQFRLEVGGDEFFIDLLFYHTRIKCYVVVELKSTAFNPKHAGQLNFYLAAVDAQIKAPDDKPTIGLLLCKTKNRLVAEYALSGIDKPIGVAEYQLVRALPDPLDTNLPTIESIEAELNDLDETKNGEP